MRLKSLIAPNGSAATVRARHSLTRAPAGRDEREQLVPFRLRHGRGPRHCLDRVSLGRVLQRAPRCQQVQQHGLKMRPDVHERVPRRDGVVLSLQTLDGTDEALEDGVVFVDGSSIPRRSAPSASRSRTTGRSSSRPFLHVCFRHARVYVMFLTLETRPA